MSEKSLYRTLIFFTIINFIYLIINIFISSYAMADDLEHIHASWLVWLGYVPYTDFFEHHNPLMWYLFAPLVGAFGRNILIFYVVRFFILCISLATIYCFYRLVKDFVADKLSALLAVNIFCFSSTIQGALVQFKPDALMHLCFFGGVYALFMFLNNKKQKYLNVAGVLFVCGFLFLQTILFLLVPLVIYAIYWMISKKLNFTNIVKASIAPVIICLLAIAFLFYEGNLQRYYELNWVVNSHISEEIVGNNVIDFSKLYGVLFLGFISALYLIWRKVSPFAFVFIVMWVCEFLLRAFYISIGMYYFKILLLYNAILIGIALADIYKKWKTVAYIILVMGILLCAKFWTFEQVGEMNAMTVLGVASDITNNTSEEDVVLATSLMPFGVFNKNPHYYWFSWQYIGKIDERLFHYAEPFDINQIIIKKKPKFIYFEDNLNENYVPNGVYDIQPNLLNDFYHNAKYNTLYMRN